MVDRRVDGKQVKSHSIPETALANELLALLLKSDGTTPWSALQNANGQRLTNLGAPQSPNDAVRYADLQAFPWKDRVVVAAPGNVTLSGLQTIDGEALTANMRVLTPFQTNPSERKVWIVAAGAWLPAQDTDTLDELRGAIVPVEKGLLGKNKHYAYNGESWVDIGEMTPAAFPTLLNKNMVALATGADYALATNVALAAKPANGSYVRGFCNRLGIDVGNGTRTCDLYFSSDGGATAKSFATLIGNEAIYWVQSNSYPLAVTDVLDLDYVV